jgi:hypothetical protein
MSLRLITAHWVPRVDRTRGSVKMPRETWLPPALEDSWHCDSRKHGMEKSAHPQHQRAFVHLLGLGASEALARISQLEGSGACPTLGTYHQLGHSLHPDMVGTQKVSLQEKGIHSSAFLCSSGPMFITENMFLSLKTDVHNLCTSARPRNIRWILMFLSQVQQHLLATRPGPALPSPSCWWPIPTSACSSSESRAPLCINFFFLIKINKFICQAKNTMDQ